MTKMHKVGLYHHKIRGVLNQKVALFQKIDKEMKR